MWLEKYAAEPEYATAKISVWWDRKDCPIPEGYDARRVRPSIERALKKLGYSGPVSITAYGDQKQTPDHLLRGLSSTGVAVAHTIPESRCSLMFSDMVEWRSHNPPPATMMLISNQVTDVFSWDLSRLQQETKYNFCLACSDSSKFTSLVVTSAEWYWEELLYSKLEDEVICRAMFYCKSCDFHCHSLRKYKKHLSSRGHALKEASNPTPRELPPVTRMWGRNYMAKPEYATAKIAVWWDMDCPIPEGYDPRQVRPSIEREFKNLGYSGPVSITAYGDQTQTPDHLLRGLSSTGVDFAHAIFPLRYHRMFGDLLAWQDLNPPPATMMLISDLTDFYYFAQPLAKRQQKTKYNMFLAYSSRPYKMSVLVTSAEWLWESLLAVSETRRHVLQRCSARGESTGTFYCKSCFCDSKSLDHFIKHLSTKEHAYEEYCIHERARLVEQDRLRQPWINEADFPKSKRLRKAFQTGFRPFHNHLHLTNSGGARRRARKSQTCRKEW